MSTLPHTITLQYPRMHEITLLLIAFLSLFFSCVGFDYARVVPNLRTRTAINCDRVADGTASGVLSAPSGDPLVYKPDGTSYVMCGACKTAYVVEDGTFEKGGE